MSRVEEVALCLSPMLEIAQAVEEVGGEELRKCYQCGTCTSVCPWGNLMDFNPRNFIQMVNLGLEDFEEAVWTCVNCKLCWDRCPQQINIPELFQAVRSVLLEWGSIPSELKFSVSGLRNEGNPWGEKRDERQNWAEKKEVPFYEKGMEQMLFTCCANDYDSRNQEAAAATVNILKKAKLDFGYLGNRGTCCGDMVYSIGETEVFDQLSDRNIQTLNELSPEEVITISPHCLNSFRNRYPADAGINSIHITELLERLLLENRLGNLHTVEKKITYHDPCYLGRYNEIYDAPRNVLSAIPGLELIEMAHNRERSLCCGGGGGGAWLETKKGERIGDVRIFEALDTGAECIATACPYCVQMLEASILGFNLQEKLKVATVSELLWESLSGGGENE